MDLKAAVPALVLILVSLSLMPDTVSAQFEDTEGNLAQCEKSCCEASGGSYDTLMQSCDIGASSPEFNAYTSCDNSCVEQAGTEIGGMRGNTSLCCAPAALVFGVVLAAAFRISNH